MADLHPWTGLTVEDAVKIQHRLRGMLVLEFPGGPVRAVAGVDCAILPDRRGIAAAAVLLSFPALEPLGAAEAVSPFLFPYIPGLLSFREGPAILEAFRRLPSRPDVAILDGHGVAHPRGFGLASHIGLWLDLPTIGCAKSRLVGDHREPGPRPGDHAPLRFEGRTVGSVLRTRPGVRPVYVSCGHLMDLASARRIVAACLQGFRLPEPTRRADHLANERARAPGARNGR